MKFLDLSAKLKEEIKNVYMLIGQDAYLRQTSVKLIKKATVSNLTESFDESIFNNENFDLTKIDEAVNSLPFGDGYKLVVLKEIPKLLEADKKQLEKIIENVPPSTCIVLDMAENINNFKQGEIIDCSSLDVLTLNKYINVECKKQNVNIEKDAANLLIEYTSASLTEIITELPKLLAYVNFEGIITVDVVKKLVKPNEDFQVFELTESLGTKNKEKSIKILNLMLKNKDVGILALISNHFRRIVFAGISNYSNEELADMFKVKPYAIQKARIQSGFFTKIQLKNILNLLDDVDFMIKSGKMQNENALYYLIFKILDC